MRHTNRNEHFKELDRLCVSVRAFITEKEYDACLEPICKAMEHYPDAPHPHNLLGILLEKKGDHAGAMKHFRAAWALDPGYLPAKQNLENYGTFFSNGICAFDESDVLSAPPSKYEVVYDERGVGHMVRRAKL